MTNKPKAIERKALSFRTDYPPIDIIDAAKKLTDYFAERDIQEWKLLGVQNRVNNHDELVHDMLVEALNEINTLPTYPPEYTMEDLVFAISTMKSIAQQALNNLKGE